VAKNRKYALGNTTLKLMKAIAQTAARTSNKPISGDPVRIGNIPGVALLDADSDGKTVVQIDGVFELLVGGIDQSGNSAVLGGDKLYFTEGDTPPVNKKNTGVPFGYAHGDHAVQMVASAATTTKIEVLISRF
jgi:predicted RecA/RadA family phage recombinase